MGSWEAGLRSQMLQVAAGAAQVAMAAGAGVQAAERAAVRVEAQAMVAMVAEARTHQLVRDLRYSGDKNQKLF